MVGYSHISTGVPCKQTYRTLIHALYMRRTDHKPEVSDRLRR